MINIPSLSSTWSLLSRILMVDVAVHSNVICEWTFQHHFLERCVPNAGPLPDLQHQR